MNRIVFLPVDERFCTRDYFILACNAMNIEIITPPKDLLGKKKVPPDMTVLLGWLDKNIQPSDLLVLSIDMLVYGGLIPSRIGIEKYSTLENRLNLLKAFKSRQTKIYATSALTRIPAYNMSEEEPDYWDYFGETIYKLSKEYTKKQPEETFKIFLRHHNDELHDWIIDDLCERRERNFKVIEKTIDLLNEGIIDFYNLVLDDNSENSMSIFEANQHALHIKENNLTHKVSIHPGADEAALTLLSRAMCDHFHYSPKFKIEYINPDFKAYIPPYEGSPFKESLKNHIEAAGGKITDENEDILFIANNPINKLNSDQQKKDSINDYSVLNSIDTTKRIISFSDPKYVNGADNQFVERILNKQIDWKTANYSGWNTSGNTIGTSCALSILQYFGKTNDLSINESEIEQLMSILLLEHWGFQANVRMMLLNEVKKKGIHSWTIIPYENWGEKFVEENLKPFLKQIKKTIKHEPKDLEVYFPWHRSFEIGIKLQ